MTSLQIGRRVAKVSAQADLTLTSVPGLGASSYRSACTRWSGVGATCRVLRVLFGRRRPSVQEPFGSPPQSPPAQQGIEARTGRFVEKGRRSPRDGWLNSTKRPIRGPIPCAPCPIPCAPRAIPAGRQRGLLGHYRRRCADVLAQAHCGCLSAVTSISIFIRGSARPAEIIIAAGRIVPKYFFSTGQHWGNSLALGST